MAKVKVKQGHRCRVSFSMSVSLWVLYQANLKAAQQVKAFIDFNDDFEVWFRRQNHDVALKLAEFGGTTAATATTAAPTPVTTAEVSPVVAVMEVSTISEVVAGAVNG
jgi:hypothetical protein